MRLWQITAPALILLVAVYLACRNAVILLADSVPPGVAVKIAPAAGEVLQRIYADRKVRDVNSHRLAQITQRAPLSPFPFLVAAERARQSGDFERSATYLEAAVRRQDPLRPADPDPLLMLYLLRGRWIDSIDLIRWMWRVRPNQRTQLADELLRITTDLRGRALLLRRLSGDRAWCKEFIPVASSIRPDDPFLDFLPGHCRFPDARPVRLSSDGYFDWILQLPRAELRRVQAVFDERFQSKTASSPFSWIFAKGERAWALPSQVGLVVSVSGWKPQMLAQQHLLLPSDRYRLESRFLVGDGSAGSLGWVMHCQDGRRFATIPAQRGSREYLVGTFRVDAGCDIQRLELVGSGRSGKPMKATILSVRIVRIA